MPTSSCRVCAVTAVPQGCGDRGERNAWTNPPCAPRCYYCLLSPKLCWVDDIHSPWLRWYLCIWLLPNTVWMVFLLWMTLLFWLPVIPLIIFFLIPLLFVGQYSALTQSNYENKEKQCFQSAIECKVAMPGVERLPCRREFVRGERGRSLRMSQINPLRHT
ncbi:putative retrotransposon hot spot protein (RHS,) [Trypanosoma cruzi]|uniref:Putative retrotransposon hot spot protein (RHS,) n=1 Tax=Trypanosoma cruzi TaxID=5693 RepID=A0A2V2UXH7_TRYCR|nr:putative retrotransposon hot spot protein (RHS,) [Trypanosoma cruzi]